MSGRRALAMLAGVGTAGVAMTGAAAPPACAAARQRDAGPLVYDLEGRSTMLDGRRLLLLPPRRWKEWKGDFVVTERCLRIRLLRRDVLAGRTTRLRLGWSADRGAVAEREVRFSVAGAPPQVAWLRPSAAGGSRRLILEVPAEVVRRHGGLVLGITVATRAAAGMTPRGDGIDGLEMELVP